MTLPAWWPSDKPWIIADCLKIMEQMPDKCVELCLTDPPYGIDIANNPFRQKFIKSDWDNNPVSQQAIDEIFRISKNQIIFGGNYFNLPPSQGFIIWDKEQPEDFSSSMCEMAWMSFQSPAKMFRYRVITETKYHPTQKPCDLFTWILEKYSEPNQIVFDPFLGSGTTLLACRKTGRIGIGVEICKDYEPIIRKRSMQDITKLDYFGVD